MPLIQAWCILYWRMSRTGKWPGGPSSLLNSLCGRYKRVSVKVVTTLDDLIFLLQIVGLTILSTPFYKYFNRYIY